MRSSIQEALDRERAHCRGLQAQLSAAPNTPLTADEEAALRHAADVAVGRERAEAAAAVREMRALSERAVRDGSAALQVRFLAALFTHRPSWVHRESGSRCPGANRRPAKRRHLTQHKSHTATGTRWQPYWYRQGTPGPLQSAQLSCAWATPRELFRSGLPNITRAAQRCVQARLSSERAACAQQVAAVQEAADREADSLKSQLAILQAAVQDAEGRARGAQRRARADARAAVAKSKASTTETLAVRSCVLLRDEPALRSC